MALASPDAWSHAPAAAPGAVLVRLDGRRARQPFRLTQTPVQRLTQVAAVVHQRRRDIRMDLPRQLTERLPRFARRAAAEQALVHRLPAASASAAAATARSFGVCATLAKLVPLRPTLSVTPVGW